VGTQHVVDERELDRLVDTAPVAIPEAWRKFADGTPQPDWERIVRRGRLDR